MDSPPQCSGMLADGQLVLPTALPRPHSIPPRHLILAGMAGSLTLGPQLWGTLLTPALHTGALQAQERVHSTGRELQALAAAPDLSEKAGSTLGALAAMCLDGTGADLRCSVICAKLALDADVFRPR